MWVHNTVGKCSGEAVTYYVYKRKKEDPKSETQVICKTKHYEIAKEYLSSFKDGESMVWSELKVEENAKKN